LTDITKLVFIGGAPGVGKSSVARELLDRLDHCVWLDGDDLWRMHPFVVNDTTTNLVEHNIQFVLRSFIQTKFSTVIFTWVLHKKSIVDRLIQGVGDLPFQFFMFTLTCDEGTLTSRLSFRTSHTTNIDLALQRLRQTLSIDSLKIDTIGKEPRVVAEEIIKKLFA
jgi:broad-specificity NMP kinase